MEFARKAPEPAQAPSPWRPAAIPTEEMVAPQIQEEKHSTELDELRLREEQIEELLLTDPFAAEEMIRLGELPEDLHGSSDG